VQEHESAPPAAAPPSFLPAARGSALPVFGPFSADAVLALQRTAGNVATSRRLARNGGGAQHRDAAQGETVRSDRSPGPGPPFPDSFLGLNTLILEYLAAHHYANPLHQELVRHYVWGYGDPLRPTRAQMQQVIRSDSPHLSIVGDTRWAAVQQLEDALERTVRAPGGSGTATASISTSTSLRLHRHDALVRPLGLRSARAGGARLAGILHADAHT
jgi:hypothetical protein